jgi:phage terminase large subunit GpA-like protein
LGKDEESWSLDYQVIYGDPSTPHLWNDLDKILETTFEHQRELPNFPIAAVCIDSGGHYTDHVINTVTQDTKKFCHQRKFCWSWSSNLAATSKSEQKAKEASLCDWC